MLMSWKDTSMMDTTHFPRSPKGFCYHLIFALFAVLLLQPADFVRAQNSEALTFDQETRIWVEGTSTIHDWSCEAEEFSGTVTPAPDAEQPLPNLQSTSLTISVEQFECGKSKMNRKLREAFKIDDHPTIEFEASTISAQVASAGSGPATSLLVKGDLTMAGTTRTIEVRTEGYDPADGRLKFTGQHTLDMTDYQMDPPTAIWGTIKTGEEVTVRFEVLATQK